MVSKIYKKTLFMEKYIKNIINKNDFRNSLLIIRNKNLHKDLLKLTKFLDDVYDVVYDLQRLWHIKNNMYSIKKCRCGSPSVWSKRSRKYKLCSNKCIRKTLSKKSKRNLKAARNSRRNTNIKKYGVEEYFSSKEFGIKRTQTMINKYGSAAPMSNPNIRRKFCETSIKNHGKPHPSMSETVRGKIRNRWKNSQRTISDEHKGKISDYYRKLFVKALPKGYSLVDYGSTLVISHDKCKNVFKIPRESFSLRKCRYLSELCTYCNPLGGKNVSDKERKLKEFLKANYGGNIIENSNKIISPYQIDIYLPDIKLAIEFNGVYWHSEAYKDKTYHINKTIKCITKNIRLLHVWEDDWLYRQEIVKSIINGYLNRHSKIYARKCKIVELSSEECRSFINDSHIQGFVPATVYYGLVHENKLVQVMSFKRIKNNDWEISRLCSRLNHSVIGGTSRLFRYFIKSNVFDSLISYSLNDYFNGNVYKKLGMKFVKYTNPSYWYLGRGSDIRLSRQKFQKKKLIKQGFDPDKSEHEIMLERGFLRIYNSGNRLWKL